MTKPVSKKYLKDEDLLIKIGVRLRETRLIRKMSQEELATECELDYSQINRMELGKVNFSISHLYLVAKELQIDPKELLP